MSFFKTFQLATIDSTLGNEFKQYAKQVKSVPATFDGYILPMPPWYTLNTHVYEKDLNNLIKEQLHRLKKYEHLSTPQETKERRLAIENLMLPIDAITIYIIINEPLSRVAVGKFIVESPIQIWKLMYLQSALYQKIEEEIDMQENPISPAGKFGILRSPVGNLIYSGYGKIVIDNGVAICNFHVQY